MKVKVDKGGYMPKRAHFDDAGIDFRTPEAFTLKAHGGQHCVDLKVHVQIPVGYFGKMESKSGLFFLHGVACMGGVVDSGFRGSVKVRMINHGEEDYTFQQGDKLVQMVLIPVGLFDLEEADHLDFSVSGRNS